MPEAMVWFAVLPVYAPLLFVGCSLLPCAQSVRVDHSSPLALMKSQSEALCNRDFRAALQCVAPEERRYVKVDTDVLEEYDRLRMRLLRLVQKRIGEAEALLLASAMPDVIASMAEESRDARIVQQTDTEATVAAPGQPPIQLRRMNGRWYVWSNLEGARNTPFGALGRAIAEKAEEGWSSGKEYLRGVQRRIKRGDINRDNFREWLDNEFKKHLGISGDPAASK